MLQWGYMHHLPEVVIEGGAAHMDHFCEFTHVHGFIQVVMNVLHRLRDPLDPAPLLEEETQFADPLMAEDAVVDLIDNRVKGIHLYTLNKSKATLHIYHSLGIENFQSLQKP